MNKTVLWIIILIVLMILLGVIAYFVLSGDSSSIFQGVNKVPSPPPLPS